MHVVNGPILGLLALATIAAIGLLVVAVVWKLLSFVLGVLFDSPRKSDVPRGAPVPPPLLVCPNPRCRNPNRQGARFCAMCGDRLKSPYNTDTYG